MTMMTLKRPLLLLLLLRTDHPVTVAPPADPVSDDDDVNYEVLVIIKVIIMWYIYCQII